MLVSKEHAGQWESQLNYVSVGVETLLSVLWLGTS